MKANNLTSSIDLDGVVLDSIKTETGSVSSVPVVLLNEFGGYGFEQYLPNDSSHHLTNITRYSGSTSTPYEISNFFENGRCVYLGKIQMHELEYFAHSFARPHRMKRMYLQIGTDVLPKLMLGDLFRDKNPLPKITNPYDLSVEQGIRQIIEDLSTFKKDEFILDQNSTLALRQWRPFIGGAGKRVAEASFRIRSSKRKLGRPVHNEVIVYDCVVRFEGSD